MKRIKIVVLLIILVVFGCSSTQKTIKQEQQNPKKPKIKMVEDLDPVALADDNFVIKPKFKEPKPDKNISYFQKDSTVSVESDSEMVKIINVRGFRIQIGQVINEEDASEIRREAMLTFENANVYLIFDAPNYKIRVGDFEKRRDAEELQDKAISLGYKDAWIVPTMIEKEVIQ
jgi:hypothetical protein